MLTSPYKIIVIAQVSAPPSDEQMLWMNRRLKMLATSALNLGLSGDCIHVLVYPMLPFGKKLPLWAANWLRPEHCAIQHYMLGYGWNTCVPGGVKYAAGNAIRECLASDPDEVWCLNAPGHGQLSQSPAARVWRRAQELTAVAPRFKLVPSWVNSDVPEKPAKEKRNAKADGNKRSSPAPASSAGGGRGKRVAKEPARSPWGVPRTRY